MLWPLHTIFSFVVDTHKLAFSTLLRVFACIYRLFAYFEFWLWGWLNQGLIPFALPLCELGLTLHFHLLSLWFHSHSMPSCNDTSYVIVFKSNLNSTSVCLARSCITWHWHTFSHHDLDPCMFHLRFTSFDLISMNVCFAYDVCVYLPSYGLLLVLLTMRPFWFTYTHFLAFAWLCFALIVSLSHTPFDKCTPTPMTCNNFIALCLIAFCLGSF